MARAMILIRTVFFRHPEEDSGVEVGVLGPDQDQVFPSGQQVQVRGPAQGQRGGEVEEGVKASAGFEPMIKVFFKGWPGWGANLASYGFRLFFTFIVVP